VIKSCCAPQSSAHAACGLPPEGQSGWGRTRQQGARTSSLDPKTEFPGTVPRWVSNKYPSVGKSHRAGTVGIAAAICTSRAEARGVATWDSHIALCLDGQGLPLSHGWLADAIGASRGAGSLGQQASKALARRALELINKLAHHHDVCFVSQKTRCSSFARSSYLPPRGERL
jgi:hypothetical protein